MRTARTSRHQGLDVEPPPRPGRWKNPRPQIGLGVLLASAAFPVRFEVGSGRTASLFDLAMPLIAVQLLFMLSVIRSLPAPPKAILAGITIPTTLTFSSLWWSVDKGSTLLATLSWLEALLVTFFVVAVFRDQYPVVVIRWMKRFALLLLVPPVLMYLHVPGFLPPGELAPTSGDYLSYYTRLSHPFIGRSNNLATLLAILFLPLVYWAARYRKHLPTTLLVGAAILATLSRGGFLAVLVAGIGMAVGARDRAAKVARRLVQPMIAGAVLIAVVLTLDSEVASRFSSRLDASNVTVRRFLLSEGWQTFLSNMWLGAGGGTGINVHNTYLQQLMYFGLVLGAVVVLALLSVPRWFFREKPKNRLDGALSRAAGWGVVAGYLTFFTESSLEGTLLRPEIFLCIALCVALAMSGRRTIRLIDSDARYLKLGTLTRQEPNHAKPLE